MDSDLPSRSIGCLVALPRLLKSHADEQPPIFHYVVLDSYRFIAALGIVMFPVLVTLIALAERSGAPTFLAHPVFIRLGQCSFGIYLLHPFVAIMIALILRKCGWTNLPCLVLGATAGIVLSTLMAIASFRWFETPARKFLSRPVFAVNASTAL